MDSRLIRRINWHHALLQASFWACYCAIWSYATVILLYRGFTNTQVGFIIAAGTIMPVAVSPQLSALADRNPRYNARRQSLAIAALLLLSGLILWIFGQNKTVNVICFILVGMLCIILPAFISVIINDYTLRGYNVNFNMGRGIGSAGYAVLSPVLGMAVERYTPSSAILIFIFFSAALFLALLLFRYPLPPMPSSRMTGTPISSAALLKKYPAFALMILGCGLMLAGHSVTSTYLIHVCEKAGGGNTEYGIVLAITAFVEIPIMATFHLLLHKKPLRFWLVLCGVGYILRQLFFAIAVTPFMLYIAAFTQIIENGLFVPSTVLYVVRHLDAANQAKGQSLMYTLSNGIGPIAVLVGGKIYDNIGIGAMMLLSVSLSSIGAAILVISLFGSSSKKKERNALT